jgi:hypothetical protein
MLARPLLMLEPLESFEEHCCSLKFGRIWQSIYPILGSLLGDYYCLNLVRSV